MQINYITNAACPPPPSPETVRACKRAAAETASALFAKAERASLQKTEVAHVDAVKRIAENDHLAVKSALAAAEQGLIGGTPAEKIAALEEACGALRNAPLLHSLAEADFHRTFAEMDAPALRLLEAVVALVEKAISGLPQIPLPDPLPRWQMNEDLAAILAARLGVLRDFVQGEIAAIRAGAHHQSRYWLAASGAVTLADDGAGLQRLPE